MLANKEVNCEVCNGTGKEKCRACGGNGSILIPITNEEQPCPTCSNGFLACSSCSGTGKKTISVEVPDPKPEPKPEPIPQEKPQQQSEQPAEQTSAPGTNTTLATVTLWICIIFAIITWIVGGHFMVGVTTFLTFFFIRWYILSHLQ